MPTPISPTTRYCADIIVLGAGPAGAVVARELAVLGYSVLVINRERPNPAVEAISARTAQALAQRGFRHTLATLSAPAQRHAYWASEQAQANTEYLLEREAFNRALIADLSAYGNIRYLAATATAPTLSAAGQWQLQARQGPRELHITGRYLVDARGRGASRHSQRAAAGPGSLSLCQHWRSASPQSQALSLVASTPNGWVWVAKYGDNTLYTQWLGHGGGLSGQGRDIAKPLHRELATVPQLAPFLSEFSPVTPVTARPSRCSRAKDLADDYSLKVGDAAMTVDPLSGNGMFQSLSNAVIAARVINTVLRKPRNRALALDFYQQRIDYLFLRFARYSRDFYRQEQRWGQAEFWRQRRHWPDAQPASYDRDQVLGEAVAAVVDNDFIEQRKVVRTRNYPMGVWRVNGQPIHPASA